MWFYNFVSRPAKATCYIQFDLLADEEAQGYLKNDKTLGILWEGIRKKPTFLGVDTGYLAPFCY